MKSLVSIDDLSPENVRSLVDRALDPHKTLADLNAEPVSLIFLEPSTRTRVSFECAVHGLNGRPIVIQENGSSFEKEETLKDTLLNLKAMGIRVHIIRCKAENEITKLAKEGFHVVNGGDGTREHPTQALLDLTTLKSLTPKWDDLNKKTLCIVGDLRSSRVARSWAALAPKVGINLRLCSPAAWKPWHWGEGTFHTEKLKEAIEGADFVMALRVQKERHSGDSLGLHLEDYVRDFQISRNNLASNALLMHPGPINWGVELNSDLQNDNRSIIMLQVKMGLSLRKVVLSQIFESLP